jgi:hypothetical protein
MKPTEKRFTDVKKWEREWYLNLSSDEKVVWQFLVDNCDKSGFWVENWTIMKMLTGIPITEMPIPLLKQVKTTNTTGVWFIKDYPAFQYGVEFASKNGYLQRKCVEDMERYGVGGTLSPPLPSNTPQEGEVGSPMYMDINMDRDVEIVDTVEEFCNHQMIKYPHYYKNIDKQIKVGYDVVEKLIRIDGYSLEVIRNSLTWAVNDDFWAPNIITITGLRKKSKNGATKFQNMLSKFQSTDTTSKVEDFVNG